MQGMFPYVIAMEGVALVKFELGLELGDDGENHVVVGAQDVDGIGSFEQPAKLDPDALDGDTVKQAPQFVHRIRGLGLDDKPEPCGKAQATHDAQSVLGEAFARIADGA